MRFISACVLALVCVMELFALRSGAEIAAELGINPKERLARQWEYVYKRERMREQYGITKLQPEEQEVLKSFLISNAADADRSDVAGSF